MLIVLGPTYDVDIRKWRRKVCIAIWITELVFFPVSQVPWYLIVVSKGFPEVSMNEIMQPQKPEFALVAVVNNLTNNLPDMISVSVYLKMVWSLRRLVQPSADLTPTNQEHDTSSDLAYGGIWVGEGPELENHSPPPLPNENSQASHNEKNVMRALKWHALLSLTDVALVTFAYFYCISGGKELGNICQILCYFYIPFLLVRFNFKQLQGIETQMLFRLKCCKN